MLLKYRRVRLRIYRGHEKSCINHCTGRSRDSCRCTWWFDGVIDGKRWNKSLRTRNRDVALDIVREMEVTGEVIEQPPPAELVTLSVACEKFLADSSARGLREATCTSTAYFSGASETLQSGVEYCTLEMST